MLQMLTLLVAMLLANVVAAQTFQGKITNRRIMVNRDRLISLLGAGARDPKQVFAMPTERLEGLAKAGDKSVNLQQTSILVSGMKLRSDDIGPDKRRFMIVDLEKKVVQIFDPTAKTYSQLAPVNHPAAEHQAALKPLNKTSKVNGFKATAYELKAAGEDALVWVSTDDGDLVAFCRRAFPAMSAVQQMAPRTEDVARTLASAHGVPVRIQVLDANGYTIDEITSVQKQTLPPETFNPEGFHM